MLCNELEVFVDVTVLIYNFNEKYIYTVYMFTTMNFSYHFWQNTFMFQYYFMESVFYIYFMEKVFNIYNLW